MDYKKQKTLVHFNNKNVMLVILILIIAVFISAFSARDNFNFISNVNLIFSNPYSNLLLMLANLINVRYFFTNDKYKYNVVNRYKTYGNYLKKNILDITGITIYVIISYIIISIAFSIALSFGNFSSVNYDYYKISLYMYLIFFTIRNSIILILISKIYYLFLENNNSIINFVLIFLLLGVFILPIVEKIKIGNFYLIFSVYFSNGIYNSFSDELINSFIIVILLYLVSLIILRFMDRNKKDLL